MTNVVRDLFFGNKNNVVEQFKKNSNLEDAVIAIQKTYRGYRARRRYKIIREAMNDAEQEILSSQFISQETADEANVRKLKPKSEQMFIAVSKNMVSVVLKLLSEASDPANRHQNVVVDSKRRERNTLNVNWKEPSLGETALIVACKNGFHRIVKYLLEYRGGPESQSNLESSTELVDVNLADDFGYTPLMHASMNGHLPILKLLRGAGYHKASVYLKDHDGWSALLHAADCGHWHCIEFLQSENADIAVRSNIGDTALIKAANNNHLLTVKILYDFLGGDIDTPNRFGNTPAMSAAYYGRIDVLEFLVEQGADTAHKNMFGETLMSIRPNPLALKNYTGTEKLPAKEELALDALQKILIQIILAKQSEKMGNNLDYGNLQLSKLSKQDSTQMREMRLQMQREIADPMLMKDRQVSTEEYIHDHHIQAKQMMNNGDVMFELHEYEAAYIYYKKATELAPSFLEYKLKATRAKTMYEHYRKLLYQQTQKAARIQARIYHENAKRYLQTAKLNQAQWWIKQALKVDKDSPEFNATYSTLRHVRRKLAQNNLNWSDVDIEDMTACGALDLVLQEFEEAEKKFGMRQEETVDDESSDDSSVDITPSTSNQELHSSNSASNKSNDNGVCASPQECIVS